MLYTISDGRAFRSGKVEITVTGNTPPEAAADTASTDADNTVVINLLGNDSDADGQNLTLSALDTAQTEGTVTDNGNGTVTYNPAGVFDNLTRSETGTTTFGYTVVDEGGLASSAIATVTVRGVRQTSSSSGGGGALNLLVLALLAGRRLRQRSR